MRIAVMMRVLEQDTGLRFFTESLLRAMLAIDRTNSYLLLHRRPERLGLFADYANVEERLAPASRKLVWDQCVVPYRAWRSGADVIFNPKFSVPLVSHCPVVMGLQEPAWWAIPEHHTWLDVRYMKLMLPLYCRKASHLLPWSQFILDENRKYLGLRLRNATPTYTAASEGFVRVLDARRLVEFREKHGLPDPFILSVTRVENLGDRSATFSGTKNVETTLRAYARIRDRIPHGLVIAGRRVREYLEHTGWTEADLRGITFTGFVPHEELPLLYSAADLFVIPSTYEGCPTTMIEAMTCGLPVVASRTGPCPEVSGGAALLADPYDPEDFAEKMLAVASDPGRRRELAERSLRRSAFFDWETTARRTLEALSRSAAERRHGARPARDGT